MGSKSRKRKKRSKCFDFTFNKKVNSGKIEFDNSANKTKTSGCLTIVTCIGIILLAICLIFAIIYANR
nr:MAG TPA: Protein melan-A [Caudoviricetes sp.]